MKFSIIMPVYNAEKVLPVSLESIRAPRRNQAVRTAQILVIQDRPRGLPPARAPRKRLTGGHRLF